MSFDDLLELVHDSAITAFGEVIEINYLSGGSDSVEGIFDANHEEVTAEGAVISTDDPMVTLQLSKLSSTPKQGDLVTARTRQYEVSDVQEDGRGQVKLILVLF